MLERLLNLLRSPRTHSLADLAHALDAIEARWMSHLAGKLDMGQIAVARKEAEQP